MNLKQYHIEESQIKVENGKGKKDRVVHCYLTVLLRDIDKYADFSFIYLLVEDKYDQSNGRPSLDPVMLIKLPLIQYLYGIKSMRKTIKEVEVNMAYRWFLGLDIQDSVPHFSTFGKNYSRRFKGTDIFE